MRQSRTPILIAQSTTVEEHLQISDHHNYRTIDFLAEGLKLAVNKSFLGIREIRSVVELKGDNNIVVIHQNFGEVFVEGFNNQVFVIDHNAVGRVRCKAGLGNKLNGMQINSLNTFPQVNRQSLRSLSFNNVDPDNTTPRPPILMRPVNERIPQRETNSARRPHQFTNQHQLEDHRQVPIQIQRRDLANNLNVPTSVDRTARFTINRRNVDQSQNHGVLDVNLNVEIGVPDEINRSIRSRFGLILRRHRIERQLADLHETSESEDSDVDDLDLDSLSDYFGRVQGPPVPLKSIQNPIEKKAGECAICFEAIMQGDKGTGHLDCNHWYHVECVQRWVNMAGVRDTCPQCRATTTAIHQVSLA